MRDKTTRSFDDLLKSYYGIGSKVLRDPSKINQLLASYYGNASAETERPRKRKVTSTNANKGDVLPKKGNGAAEYVVGQSLSPTEIPEYVVAAPAQPAVPPPTKEPAPPDDVKALRESQVDVLQPLKKPMGVTGVAAEERPADARPAAPAVAPRPEEAPATSQSASDDDFIADMQSILSGEKVFDPVTKKATDKETLRQRQDSDGGLPAPDAKNGQAIFDRIAQSMQYANAYDLGTVELENRFASFDQVDELQAKSTAAKKAKQATGAPNGAASPVSVDSEDFLRDLDEIRKQSPATISSPQSVDDYSAPLFATGEHVLLAEDQYPDKLRVGKPPGVLFSYGQVIAMPDLYRTVEDMMAAPVDELNKLKTLIAQNTAFYKKNKASPEGDFSETVWNDATGGRYLDLAEKNYEHFSPAASATAHGTNKAAWESHHKRAIEAVQQAFASNARATVPDMALIVNAFGDHFLTDAFASGHLINKDVAINAFKARFLNAGALTEGAKKFFDKVAKLAFKGDVKTKFSVLETVEPVKGITRLKIDADWVFAGLLGEAAVKQPDTVANIAAKAIHDKLNKEGVEVTNEAGDKWTLKGDSFLLASPQTLAIAKKAVKQSIDNINDPAVRGVNVNVQPLFARVWKYVPRPIPGSQKVEKALADYTNPDSEVMAADAAAIITQSVDTLIKRLIKDNYLRPVAR